MQRKRHFPKNTLYSILFFLLFFQISWGQACDSFNPCYNGGACVDDGTGGYRCVCTELFIGNECRTRVANPIATPPTAPVVLKNATNVALGDDIQIEVFVGGAPEIHNGPYRQKVLNFTITGGTVTLGTAGITFGGDENSSASFTATGSTDNVNAALDAATFTPTPNLTGTDVATISFTCYYGDPFMMIRIINLDMSLIMINP